MCNLCQFWFIREVHLINESLMHADLLHSGVFVLSKYELTHNRWLLRSERPTEAHCVGTDISMVEWEYLKIALCTTIPPRPYKWSVHNPCSLVFVKLNSRKTPSAIIIVIFSPNHLIVCCFLDDLSGHFFFIVVDRMRAKMRTLHKTQFLPHTRQRWFRLMLITDSITISCIFGWHFYA